MKISFYQQSVSDAEKQQAGKTGTEKARGAQNRRSAAVAVNLSAGEGMLAIGGRQLDSMPGRGAERGRSLASLQQEAEYTDVGIRQDYMTVMSNTMSGEDYARLQEDGFDFSAMKPEEAVTIVDKIKAELARSGQHIAGYTDDLDMETLAAALGSTVLAQAVADSFAQADIPMTEENLAAVEQAWNMAGQLQPMEDGAYSYLIDNELEPEIWNLYLAENSGAGNGGSHGARFYAEDVRGYYAEAAGTAQGDDMSGLQEQVDRVIRQSGREVTEETRQAAEWLFDRGLPVTEENLDRLEELRQIELPVTEEAFARAAAEAIAEGKNPVYGTVGEKSGNLYEKAAATVEYYHSSELWESTAGDITARRQLEEIRLRMTAEVNVKLLKSGFSIDTAPMEQLVEALRQAEKELAESYFPEDGQAVEKYHVYRQTTAAVEEIPALPAQVLGSFAEGQSVATLETFHREGAALRDTYEKARSGYEALMTAPRRDFGDSIQKAFANVDDILEDLGAELTEENRRAARILGYNRMEMTMENLETVREADRQVKNVVERLTPAATLKMIRDGVNPLEKTFEELEQYFDSLPEEYKEAAQSYSRFLYGLERKKEITEAERESYIGIYRLVRQIEKTDGAAVGALVNSQAQLHFSNLLSAVRTGKAKALDIRVTDSLGAVEECVRKGESISEQIAKAFVTDTGEALTEVSYSEEAEREYDKEELETLRQAAAARREDAVLLQRGEQILSAENLLAARALAQGEENLFEILGGRSGEIGRRFSAGERKRTAGKNVTDVSLETEEPLERAEAEEQGETAAAGSRLWEKLDNREDFQESYLQAVAEAMQAVEAETFEAGSSLDVRHMQLWHKQLGLAQALAEKEEFFLPMYVGDTLTRVHLTLDRTGADKGRVSISMGLADGIRVQADFALEGNTLSGIFAAENRNEVMKLQTIADNFTRAAEDRWNIGSISVVTAEGGQPGALPEAHAEAGGAELYQVAKVFLQSVQ